MLQMLFFGAITVWAISSFVKEGNTRALGAMLGMFLAFCFFVYAFAFSGSVGLTLVSIAVILGSIINYGNVVAKTEDLAGTVKEIKEVLKDDAPPIEYKLADFVQAIRKETLKGDNGWTNDIQFPGDGMILTNEWGNGKVFLPFPKNGEVVQFEIFEVGEDQTESEKQLLKDFATVITAVGNMAYLQV